MKLRHIKKESKSHTPKANVNLESDQVTNHNRPSCYRARNGGEEQPGPLEEGGERAYQWRGARPLSIVKKGIRPS